MRLSHLLRLSPSFFRCLGRLPLGHMLYLLAHLRNEKSISFAGQVHINSFFPPYPSVAFDRFLNAVIARNRVPHSVYYAATDECPFSCPQCSYGRRMPGRPDTSAALSVIAQIKALGTATLGLTGGEPLLRTDLPQLIAAAGKEMATVLFTTGFGLTEAKAAELKAAGLDCIMISLESDQESEHDSLRGRQGSFDSAMRAIEQSQSAGLFVGISVVATRDKINTGTLEAIYQLAESKSVHEMRILEPIATGNFAGCQCQQLTEPENQYLREFHRNKNRQKAGPSVCCFSQMESKELFGCGAGYHHLFIDAAGNVCPCDLTPLSMGNLKNKPLAQIWSEMACHFAQPRCNCLMKELAQLPDFDLANSDLPLPQEQSKALLEQLPCDNSLPGMYQRILKK